MRFGVVDVLKRARARITKGRCRFVLALDKNGCPVSPRSPWANRWSPRGAIFASTTCIELASNALLLLAECLPEKARGMTVDWFNNMQNTSQPVLALFDRAINRLETEQ